MHQQSRQLHVLKQEYFQENLSKERKSEIWREIDQIYASVQASPNSLASHLPVQSLRPTVFLVSFPRSGNTLVHRILCTLFKTRECHSFPNSGPYTFSKLLYNPKRPTVRIVKDHIYRSEYIWDKVIYIVRDGRDAFLSLAYYTYTENLHRFLKRNELKDFIRQIQKGFSFGDWFQNVSVALNAKKLGARAKIVRYEDLFGNDQALFDLAQFVDPLWKGNLSDVIEARQATDEAKKKITEKQWGYGVQFGPDSYLHHWSLNRTRSNWKESYDSEAKKAFHETGATPLLMELGYETDPLWWTK